MATTTRMIRPGAPPLIGLVFGRQAVLPISSKLRIPEFEPGRGKLDFLLILIPSLIFSSTGIQFEGIRKKKVKVTRLPPLLFFAN